ncbi:dinuclear metal center YbgI/SA1388 family protein [Chitinivorax tropicus]|uniref:GTP cyclohydrolase 1 type 2 homolog n=1 Tax=Chitinivorax tropicus TaxID=714531 RepID=A0A840MPU1_9PROT|nr:Nif3-like dinuclear metal center hexameric protein [Chitinivorax tropicus]MBB5019057.1 dinuclear metal center YbgI/SA1388 family protein [Chitinivorax tropicus]
MITRPELERHLHQLLDLARFKDNAPNGLQVEGREQIETIVTGVTANRALIEAALDLKADAILVHHGFFWKNEDARIVGIKRQRIGLLLANDLNLFGYHLPLDAHPTLGNNAQLAQKLGLMADGNFGEQNLGAVGVLSDTLPLSIFADHIAQQLGRPPLIIGDPTQAVRRVAWCTGGAQSYFNDAIAQGVDAYITGEISEAVVHTAREAGVAFIAAGHHATERYGIEALGRYLAGEFGLTHHFIDIDNPA